MGEKNKLIDKLDRVFSIYIRTRDEGICPICHREEVTECFHLIRRGKFKTRWDTDNCFGSCHPCNRYHEQNEKPARDYWVQMHSQEELEDLERKSNDTTPFTRAELEEMISRFTL